jgi:hypothetical protein
MRIAWRDKIVSLDVTYDYALLFAFTLLEAQLGIVLASIPVMQPILRKLTHSGLLGKLRTIFTVSRGTTNGDSSHRHTIGTKPTHIKLRKLGSDTDSVRPLGDDELGHCNVEDRAFSESDGRESRPFEDSAIRVSHSWDVHY